MLSPEIKYHGTCSMRNWWALWKTNKLNLIEHGITGLNICSRLYFKGIMRELDGGGSTGVFPATLRFTFLSFFPLLSLFCSSFPSPFFPFLLPPFFLHGILPDGHMDLHCAYLYKHSGHCESKLDLYLPSMVTLGLLCPSCGDRPFNGSSYFLVRGSCTLLPWYHL